MMSGFRSPRVRMTVWAYGFLFPCLLLMVVFQFFPMLQAIALSFTKYDMVTAPEFNGVANYVNVLTDPRFHRSVLVTLYYMFGHAIPLWIVSLALAMGFNQSFRGRGFFRSIYFLPTIMPPIVVGIVWVFLFHPYGLVNQGLAALGLPAVDWLTSPQAVIPAFILSSEWRSVPFFMVIFLAGLQNIPTELKEAARIDGAGPLMVFRAITLPLLKPTILLVMIVSLIGASRNFTNAFVMTGGGPDGASTVVGLYIYRAAFQEYRMGLASAAAVILFLATLLLTLTQLRLAQDGQD
jgi:multiple sugar transport system permease protein